MSMAMGVGGFPGDDYIDLPTLRQPKLNIKIEKRDNGYLVDLIDPPKRKERPKPPVPSEDEINEKLDAMSDGIAAFMRSIMDKTAGEDWKEAETKEKIRTAMKAFAPSLVGPKDYVAPPTPRIEQRVFEKKADLIKYLEENL